MARLYRELRMKMSPERRARNDAKTARMLAGIRRRMRLKRLIYATALCIAIVALGFALAGCGGTGDALAAAARVYVNIYNVEPTPEQLDLFMEINGL